MQFSPKNSTNLGSWRAHLRKILDPPLAIVFHYRPQTKFAKVVTGRKRSCGQGYVFTRVCDSVNRGEGGLRRTPPGPRRTPPGPRRTPPGPRRTPPPRDQGEPPRDQGEPPDQADPPSTRQTPPSTRQTPPHREEHCSIRSMSGRYASYWNAFLFLQVSVCPHRGSVHGCSGEACVVAPRGVCMVAPAGGMRGCSWRGACMFAPEGHVWLLPGGVHGCSPGACMVAPGGMHGCSRGHVWLLGVGGMCGCSRGHVWLLPGACMGCSPGGMHGCSWGGACMVAPRGDAWDTTRYGDTINERAVCILLECILVCSNLIQRVYGEIKRIFKGFYFSKIFYFLH